MIIRSCGVLVFLYHVDIPVQQLKTPRDSSSCRRGALVALVRDDDAASLVVASLGSALAAHLLGARARPSPRRSRPPFPVPALFLMAVVRRASSGAGFVAGTAAADGVGGFVRRADFYAKLPRELRERLPTGGFLSIAT